MPSRAHVAALADQRARARRQGGRQIKPFFLAQLRCGDGGRRHRRLAACEQRDQAGVAQPHAGLAQHGRPVCGGNRAGQLAQPVAGGIDLRALGLNRQGAEQIEQLTILDARHCCTAAAGAQHSRQAIVEMHSRSR